MNNKLICPFCQQELERVYIIPEALVCMNCHRLATKELWQALIDIKKKLDILVEGLERMTWGCDSTDAEDLLKKINNKEEK